MSTLRQKYGTKVFLGGTCNGSKWRDEVIPKLEVPYYNPVNAVAEDWDVIKESQDRRLLCNCALYVITPQMEGAYSIAEIVEDSIVRKNKVVVCFLKQYEDKAFSDAVWQSCLAIMELIKQYHEHVYMDLDSAVQAVNRL